MASDRKYINSSLIHWTGRAKNQDAACSILENICREQILRLTYCPTYVQENLKPRVAMACFTDIPLEHSHEHCSKFGQFGLAFNKQKMIEYGANPVLYTTGMHLDRIRNISNLLERMKELEKDREWRSEVEPFNFSVDETIALIEVLGLLQEYSYKNDDGTDYVTYSQREWRLTFEVLPFAGGTTEHIPGTSSFYVREGISYGVFKFDKSDIEYIIAPAGYEERALDAASMLGCNVKIYESEVNC